MFILGQIFVTTSAALRLTNRCLHSFRVPKGDVLGEIPVDPSSSVPLSPCLGDCVSIICQCGLGEEDDNETLWEVLRNIHFATSNNKICNQDIACFTQVKSCCVWLQGFLTVAWFAISLFDVVWLITRNHRSLDPVTSHNCVIATGYASVERTSGDVSLKILQGFYLKLMPIIESYCIVSITIRISVTVKMLIVLSQNHETYQHDIKNTACLQIIHMWQHPTSRLTLKSTHTTNRQYSEKALLTSSSWQLWQIDQLIHTMMSSNEWKPQWLWY